MACGDTRFPSESPEPSTMIVPATGRPRVARKPWFPALRDSLPRAGMDGTLKDIGYRNDQFRAKTGRLENVFALAGFGKDAKGREIAFAYVVNVPGGAALNLEQSGAEVMRFLAQHQ